MSNIDIIRAWKDEEYRNSLTDAQRAMLPDNPAGMIEIDEEDLDVLVGGQTEYHLSLGCCGGITNYYTCWGYTVCGYACSRWIC